MPESLLIGVLKAYSKSIDHVFYLAAASVAMTFVFCWGMGWRSIKKQKELQLGVED